MQGVFISLTGQTDLQHFNYHVNKRLAVDPLMGPFSAVPHPYDLFLEDLLSSLIGLPRDMFPCSPQLQLDKHVLLPPCKFMLISSHHFGHSDSISMGQDFTPQRGEYRWR
jgi:hypothetical protein